MAVAVWVAAALLTVATLGAGAGALAGAAAFQAALVAMQRLCVALGNGDPSAAVAAAVDLGKALNNISDGGDFAGKLAKENPKLAAFAAQVAAPFAKVYEVAGGAAASAEALWSRAQAMQSQLPKLDRGMWGQAFQAMGPQMTGAAAWLQMARLPSSAEVAGQLWANAPDWAKNTVAMGVTLAAAEQAQAAHSGSSVQFSLVAAAPKGGGVMQLSKAAAAFVKASWSAVPPPPAPVSGLSFVPPPNPGGGGAALPVLAVGAAAAFFLLRKK
jgi:hypothetical protein